VYSYTYQVSSKLVKGLWRRGGRKWPFPITLASGLCNSLYYRTSRDVWKCTLLGTLSMYYLGQPSVPASWSLLSCSLRDCQVKTIQRKGNCLLWFADHSATWLTVSAAAQRSQYSPPTPWNSNDSTVGASTKFTSTSLRWRCMTYAMSTMKVGLTFDTIANVHSLVIDCEEGSATVTVRL